MIKVQNGIATREEIPYFLVGLQAESLADLSWTDPALGVADCAWWIEERGDDPVIYAPYRYGAEIFTPDTVRQVVVVTHVIEEMPVVPPLPLVVSPRQIRQALTASGMRSAVEAGVAAGDQDTKDWWEFATSIEENHPAILAMCGGLGITDAQRHDVFVLASTL